MLYQLQKLNKYYEHLDKTVDYIKKIIQTIPVFGIILGSGLGKITEEISDSITIPYEHIPYFPQTTIIGHDGKIIFGKLADKPVIVFSGRCHYYEGYDMSKIVYPIRTMRQLGIKKVILSNASGGVNENYKVGDLMLIKDHINMMMKSPLRGPNLDRYGPRFVDMNEPYDLEMIRRVEEIAKKNNIVIHKGVYVALQGPTFETPAEYNMIKCIGGDAVGMSTVPEVIAAKHMNMKILALSIITDLGGINMQESISHKTVLEAAAKSIPRIILLIKELIHIIPT